MFFRPQDFILPDVVLGQPIELPANINQDGAQHSELRAEALLAEQFLKIF